MHKEYNPKIEEEKSFSICCGVRAVTGTIIGAMWYGLPHPYCPNCGQPCQLIKRSEFIPKQRKIGGIVYYRQYITGTKQEALEMANRLRLKYAGNARIIKKAKCYEVYSR